MDTNVPSIHRGLLHHPVVRVCASAWQARRSMRLLSSVLLLAAFLLGLIPMEVVLPPDTPAKVVRGMVAVLLSGLMLADWTSFVFNVLQQNHPQCAALVPRHVATLRRALYLGAALLAACVGAFGSWAGWSWLGTVLVVAPLCAALACALRWPVLWLLLLVVCVTASLWLKAGALGALLAWREVPWALATTVLAGTGLALRAVVFSGGATHARSQSQLVATAAAMRGEALTPSQRQFSAGWLGPTRWGVWAYAAWMRRLLAQPRSPARARLALGMGPQAHWSGVFAYAVYVLLLFLLLAALRGVLPQWLAMHGGLLIGLALVGMMVPLQLPPALWATRREQALLTLLPGAPAGAALNRWLAVRLAALDVAVMLGVIAAVAGFDHLGGSDATPSRIADVVLGALVLGLPITFALWRDWARAGAPSGVLQWAVIGASGAVGVLASTWVHWIERPWYELVAWTALVALPLGLWRWWRLQRLPAAWPVGRIVAQPRRSPFDPAPAKPDAGSDPG